MKTLTMLLAIYLLVCSPSAPAQIPGGCEAYLSSFDRLQVSRQESRSKECSVSFHSRDSYVDMIYRDYLMTASGLLMVFNSYGPGIESKSTGAREFYFFPRRYSNIELKSETELGLFSARLANGSWIQFDTKTAQAVKLEAGKIKLAQQVKPNNNGGLEIISYAGLYMDCGFNLGQSPSDNPERFCTFKDIKKNSCKVQNKKLFIYEDYERYLRSDSEIQTILKQDCPRIEWP